MYTIKKTRSGDLVFKTNLSTSQIINYTLRIVKLKQWEDTICNRVAAKGILDAMLVIEVQMYNLCKAGLYKYCPPIITSDFNQLYQIVIYSQKNN